MPATLEAIKREVVLHASASHASYVSMAKGATATSPLLIALVHSTWHLDEPCPYLTHHLLPSELTFIYLFSSLEVQANYSTQ